MKFERAALILMIAVAVILISRTILDTSSSSGDLASEALIDGSETSPQSVDPGRSDPRSFGARDEVTITLIATIPVTTEVIAIHGTELIAAQDSELAIYDVSIPSRPLETGRIDLGSPIVQLDAIDTVVVVVDMTPTLHTVDISNPMRPTIAGSVSLPTWRVRRVIAHAGHAFLLEARDRSFPTGIRVVDVQNPNSPTIAGLFAETTLDVYDAAALGDVLYAAYFDERGLGELKVLHIDDVASPFLLGAYHPEAAVLRVDVDEGKAYLIVADFKANTARLEIADVSVPSESKEIGFFDLPSDPVLNEPAAPVVADLQLYEEQIILAETRPAAYGRVGLIGEEYFLRLIGVSDPSAPVQSAELQLPAPVRRLERVGDDVFTASREHGIHVFRIHR